MTTPSFPKAEYPGYDNRHHASGDLNPPSLQPGLPTDPTLPPSLRRRVFLGREPAIGYPQLPATATYPTGTTMIGHGEEITSDAANRALYDQHRCLDAIAERERFPIKILWHTGAPIAASDVWDTSQIDPTGGGPPVALSNKHLIYLGEPGTPAAMARYYMAILKSGQLSRTIPELNDAYVEDAWTAPAGVSLYPLTNPGAVGFFPDDGAFGKIDTVAATDITCSGSVDTATNLIGRCIFNYSLCTRTAQDSPGDLWKSFAICTAQVGGPGNPATMNHDVQADGWLPNDIIYFTLVALAPTLKLNGDVAIESGSWVMSGGWDRVQNGEGAATVPSIIGLARRPSAQYPTLRISMPSVGIYPFFSFDAHDAAERITFSRRGSTALSAEDEADDCQGTGATNPGFAAFMHTNPMAFNRATILSDSPIVNQCLIAGNTISLVPGPWRFANGLDSDLYNKADLVEVVDLVTGNVTLWVLDTIIGDTAISVIRPDGDVTGAGLPAEGWCRILRPRFRHSGLITTNEPLSPRFIGGGTRLMCFEPFTTPAGPGPIFYPILEFYGRDWTGVIPDGEPDKIYRVNKWIDNGIHPGYTATVATLYADGTNEATEFRWTPNPRTFFHIVAMADGTLPILSAVRGNWKYGDHTYPYVNLWYTTLAGDVQDQVNFPINLPQGARVVKIRFQAGTEFSGVPTPMRAYFYKKVNSWTVNTALNGTPPPTWIPTGPQYNAVNRSVIGYIDFDVPVGTGHTTDFFVYELTLGVPEVIDNEDNEYWITVHSSINGVTPVSDTLNGIRIEYTMDRINLP